MRRTVDELLAEARGRIRRFTPEEAHERAWAGALLVDIRPAAQRAEHGEVPFSLIVERNVLEWRLDPASPWKLAQADGYERTVIVLCQEGYASSLAAATLADLGWDEVGDVVGGFAAWRKAGLPVR